MGVVLSQHLAHYGGRLAVACVVEHAHVVHGIKYAALYRLQTIPDIGQRARHDDRHGIVDIGCLHSSFDVNARDFFVFRNHLLYILLYFKFKKYVPLLVLKYKDTLFFSYSRCLWHIFINN